MTATVTTFIRDAGAGGKFVVLAPTGSEEGGYVVFSDFTRDFQHHDIVRRFERTHRTPLASAGLRVAGGGWWRFENGDTLILYGQSAAYGRFDPAWLRANLAAGMVGNEKRLDVR